VLGLLCGADRESTSRKHRVTIATLSDWRERFLAGGEATLKSREIDTEDGEIKRLKSAAVGVCVDNELLREKIARLENAHPLAFWKLRSRFFRTLKEQLLWIPHFRDLEELRAALIDFRERCNLTGFWAA
jgi:transposase